MTTTGSLDPIAHSSNGGGRRVLLVDTDPVRRKLRFSSMSAVGIDVCLATDAAQARLLVRESPYDLVLINLPRDRQGALKLGSDMREERPQQPVCFYVGQPAYLAAMPLPESASPAGRSDPRKDLNALITRTCDRMPGRGRLLEAAWRMCFLRRGRGEPAVKPSNGGAAKDSFGAAVRLAEGAQLDA